jgi:UDP-N-acetylmuramoyl-tripeptide--D-alanyl-D-alanine ligase
MKLTHTTTEEDDLYATGAAALWSAAELARAVRGIWDVQPPMDWSPTGVCFERKFFRPGQVLFVGDKGSSGKAISASAAAVLSAEGAAGLVVSASVPVLNLSAPVLRVADPRAALFDLARHCRKRLFGRVVAITGSVGKSTTRHMLKVMATGQGAVFGTPANYNLLEGVALSLASTPMATDFVFLEVAIGGVGSLAASTDLCQPNIAVISGIAPVHLRLRGTLQAIAEEKSLLFGGLTGKAVAILPGDAPHFAVMMDRARRYSQRVITFGLNAHNDIRLLNYRAIVGGSEVTVDLLGRTTSYCIGAPGRHLATNSMAAFACCAALDLDLDRAAGALANFRPHAGRGTQERLTINGRSFTLIDDAFNANPASMNACFDVLADAVPELGGRRIAVLGDMLELGPDEASYHRQLAGPILRAGIERVHLLGPRMNKLWPELPKSVRGARTTDLNELAAALIRDLREGDIVAVKGSHASGASKLIPLLRSRADQPDQNAKEDEAEKQVSAAMAGPAPAESCRRRTEATVTAAKEATVTILGDFYLGESYMRWRMERGRSNVLAEKGADHSFVNFRSFLVNSDFTIVNLEATLTRATSSPLAGRKSYILDADPEETLACLGRHRISAATLGNNHAVDYGRSALQASLADLMKAGILWIGAGPTEADALEPLRLCVEVDGRKRRLLVFSAFAYAEVYDCRFGFYADAREPGVCAISPELLERISGFRRVDSAALILVVPHWGQNYAWRSAAQAEIAKWLIAAGADLIIGHGAHMMQEIERISNRWTVYGIGNFIFNSHGEYKQRQVPPYSAAAQLLFSPTATGLGAELKLYPFFCDNLVTGWQPRWVTEAEFTGIVTRLEKHLAGQGPAVLIEVQHDAHGWHIILPVG